MFGIGNPVSPSRSSNWLQSLLLVSLLMIPLLSLLCGPHLAGAAPVPVFGDPDCVSWGPDRIDCVVRTKDGSFWHAYWAGSSWSAWEPLGGVFNSPPAISSWGVDRLDVFGVGQDGALWHSSWGGSGWSGWESLGGVDLKFAPDCVSWGSGRIDCFAIAADNAVWHISWSVSGWSGWESIGGVALSGPAVASVVIANLHVYVVGEEGGLWGNTWDGVHGWSGWVPVPMAGMPGGIIPSLTKPACVANGVNAGEIDCFARGTDTALWHTHLGSGTWESLGGGIDSGPAASTWGPGRLDVFAQGTDEGLWHIVWSGVGWGAWEPVPMETSTPAATTTTATIEGLQMQLVSNSSVSELLFDSTRGLLNFTVSGPTGSYGFFNATIAKSLLSGQPIVMIDGVEHPASVSQDTNFWSIRVTYPHGEDHVTIGGSNTIPEFQSFFLLAVVLTMVILALARRHRQED